MTNMGKRKDYHIFTFPPDNTGIGSGKGRRALRRKGRGSTQGKEMMGNRKTKPELKERSPATARDFGPRDESKEDRGNKSSSA